MSAQVLPKELRLQAPATMPQARSYLFKQQSTQSKYSEGQTIQLNLPRLQRSYLTKDSYLKFQVEIAFNTHKAGDSDLLRDVLCWDTPGAMGLIDRIEVFDYLGSTLLESTSGHGQLMALLLDMSINNQEFGTHYNSSVGTLPGLVRLGTQLNGEAFAQGRHPVIIDNEVALTYTAVTAEDAFATIPAAEAAAGSAFNTLTATGANYNAWDGLTTYFYQQEPITGQILSVPNDNTAADTRTVVYEYAIPLFSFLGVLSTKYAPLHNGYTINITLNSWATALSHTVCGTGADLADYVQNTELRPPEDFQVADTIISADSFVKNVYFCSQVLELGPVAESMLLSSTGGQPLIVPSKAYRNYIGSLSNAQQQFRLDLNLNVASLTNIFFIMRENGLITNTPISKKTLSGRSRNYLQNWYFQYGSSILPQTTGISARGRPGDDDDANDWGFTEAYAELMKSRHKWVSDSHDSVICAENFKKDTYDDTEQILSPYNLATRGTFAGGLDLELVSGRSNDLICGMNTNGMNTSIYLNFDTAHVAQILASRVDCWCEYDSFINISPGIATTVSF